MQTDRIYQPAPTIKTQDPRYERASKQAPSRSEDTENISHPAGATTTTCAAPSLFEPKLTGHRVAPGNLKPVPTGAVLDRILAMQSKWLAAREKGEIP